ncbi:unnamed protein product [Umbelopsis vinacea]
MAFNTLLQGSSWSDVARRGLQVPATKLRLKPIRATTYSVKSEVVYEVTGHTAKQVSQRAAAILRRALNLDSIIFELPKSTMNADLLVEEIEQQTGPIAGFTNLGQYRRDINNLTLEIVYMQKDSAQKAMADGVTIKEVVYRGTPWVDEVRRTTVKVNLSHVRLSFHASLGEKLLPTMMQYGKVLQIRKYTNTFGKFCDEVSVILDRGDDMEEDTYPELSRMIFLEDEDIYIPASYQGAPKICFHCRAAGHERQDCPELASVKCFKCKGFGRQRRHCRKQRMANDFERKLPYPDETYQQEESSPIDANTVEV